MKCQTEKLRFILDLLIENGADYVAWAGRGHYAEPYPGSSNKSMYAGIFQKQRFIDLKTDFSAFS